MKYDIYFHNDFDGYASAAVMLAFLRSRGDEVAKFVPVDHGMNPPWTTRKFSRPSIVLDFPYHPKAVFWFDHHPTAFQKKEWRRKFRPTKFLVWNSKYKSCCRLALDVLETRHGFRPSQHLRELARWLDIIDMAGYVSPRQAVMGREPAIQIGAYIDREGETNRPMAWLLELLAASRISKIARDTRIRRAWNVIEREKRTALAWYRKNLEIYDKIAYIDISRGKTPRLRYAPFYLAPHLVYGLTITRGKDGKIELHLGVNPWRRKENKIDIGKFLRENYGGGGHFVVGGAEVKSREAADRAAREIIERFKHAK